MTAATLVLAVPLVAAITLALMQAPRSAAWGNLAASIATFAAACALPFGSAASGWLLVDPLAMHLAVLTSFVALTAAWLSCFGAAVQTDPLRLRVFHAAFQALLFCLLLALLSDNIGVTWIALEGATIAGAVAVQLPGTRNALSAAWRYLILCSIGLALALLGTVLLYLAAGPGWAAMSWRGLLVSGARMNGALLNVAFVFLLVGYGSKAALLPFHAWLPDVQAEGPAPIAAILSGAELNVALVLLLRLRGVLDGNAAAGGSAMRPGPLLIAFGLISLLLAAFSLWRRRDTKRFFALSTIGQNGVAAYAFGLGGTAATFAGLLHLTVHTLARTAAFPCIGHRARHRALALTLAAGMIAAAGLPPFGVFSSTFLVISQTLSHAPLLVLPLALGLVVGGWALIARLQALCFGPPRDQTAAPGMLALAPSWLHLGVSVMLGLAMPAAVFGWMWRIAAGVP